MSIAGVVAIEGFEKRRSTLIDPEWIGRIGNDMLGWVASLPPAANKTDYSVQTINAAADRFFRTYARHCIEPDEDSLFGLLDALHSFNDKLRKAGKGDLFGSADFMALKALRNLFHHEMELLHEVKIIPVASLPVIVIDLGIICLVDRGLIERAIQREKAEQREAIRKAFKWYGTVVNVQPCVFNGSVDVFEAVQSAGLTPESEAYQDFESSYRFEELNGHAHRVTGEISCVAAFPLGKRGCVEDSRIIR